MASHVPENPSYVQADGGTFNEIHGHGRQFNNSASGASSSVISPNATVTFTQHFDTQAGLRQAIIPHNHPNFNPAAPTETSTVTKGHRSSSSALSRCYSASEAYSTVLLNKREGYPLWRPSPQEGAPPVNIGDVGFLSPEGAFIFLFNICASRGDPINSRGVPPCFPLRGPLVDMDQLNIEEHSPHKQGPCHIESCCDIDIEKSHVFVKTQDENVHFSSSAKLAAVLALPHGASLKYVYPLGFLQEIARVKTSSWFDYVDAKGYTDIRTLYLVTGSIKTRSWGVASMFDASLAHDVSLRFFPEVSPASNSCSWIKRSPAEVLCGPTHTSTDENQCVFIRGFRISRRDFIGGILRGSVRVDPIEGVDPVQRESFPRSRILPRVLSQISTRFAGRVSSSMTDSVASSLSGEQSDIEWDLEHDILQTSGGDHITVESVGLNHEPEHPLDKINNHLLNSEPNAQFAITHDSHWQVILDEENEVAPHDDDFVQRTVSIYDAVVEDGCVTLEPLISSNKSFLLHAARTGRTEMLKSLIDQGVDVNFKDNQNRTSLSYAAVGGHVDVVKHLLGRGDIDANSTDGHNCTPLSYAAVAGHVEVIKLLLSRVDLNVNATDGRKRSPLSYAAERGHVEVVKLLLGREDINVNSAAGHNRSPLSYAAGGDVCKW